MRMETHRNVSKGPGAAQIRGGLGDGGPGGAECCPRVRRGFLETWHSERGLVPLRPPGLQPRSPPGSRAEPRPGLSPRPPGATALGPPGRGCPGPASGASGQP